MTEKFNYNPNYENDKNIIFTRHLNEIDDLESFDRDAPLYDSVENNVSIEKTANLLTEKLLKNNKQAIIFIVSPRVRAIQTAELLEDIVIKKLPPNNKLRYKISINNDLRASEQGKFTLPKDYKAGEIFEGLKLASNIFENEN
jgi:broad specificity phosphatase PhoE